MTEAPVKRPRPVGEILLAQRLISSEQISEALDAQRRTGNRKLLGEIIVEMGFCTEAQVVEALADAFEVPFARITAALVDPAVVRLLPADFMRSNSVLPLFKVDGVLTVAVAEPSNLFLVEEIAQQAKCAVQVVAALRADMDAARERFGPEDGLVLDEIMREGAAMSIATLPGVAGGATTVDPSMIEALSADSPVVQLVNHLIFSAAAQGASDIHIEPDEKTLRVRFRIDGRLVEKVRPPHQMQPAIVSRIKIMAGLDISERRLPQDGAIRVTVGGRAVDLRVSTLPNKYGEKVVIRVIDTRHAMVGLNQLGMNAEVYDRFAREVRNPHGIILVTGPTGSGKSTTLYAVLSEINQPVINICTVEDPIEFHLAGVNQFQVHEKIGLSFAHVLRSLLRQDPDVIMLGEVRDAETARIAVQAALTGHLVLSTLHTNDAPSAVTRLQNLGVEPYLVSASLVAILAQRLVRRLCPHCRRAVEPSPAAVHAAEAAGVRLDAMFEGRGCAQCNQVGLKGRTGLYELLVPDDELRDLIAAGAVLGTIRTQARALGMISLLEAGFELVREGGTTLEEVLRTTAG